MKSTEQKTWDQLRVSLLREYLRSYLAEVAESDLELASVTDETVERLVQSLSGQAVSASDTSSTLLRELAHLVERTSQLSGKFPFSLSELEMIRAQVIAEAQGQGIPERAAKQLLASVRPVHVEPESEERFRGLSQRIARLEGVNAEVTRLVETAKLALQRDVIGLLGAISLDLDYRNIPAFRYIPIRVSLGTASEGAVAEVTDAVLKIAEAIGFGQA